MHVPADWPDARVRAALEADRRLRRYEHEREGRLATYERNGASAGYRIRWHERHVVLRADRFSRPLGGPR